MGIAILPNGGVGGAGCTMERACGSGGPGRSHRDAKTADSKDLWKSFGQRCKSIRENSKPPHATTAYGAPKFVLGFIVRATRPYKIQGKKGKYVSWYGIVRGISHSQPGEEKLTLLLEHKYFDGMTDCHIMMVSQSGSGDFQAKLEGKAERFPALALVRVYGTVVEEKDKVPEIAAEYVRVWPWFTFTLTDLGAGDHTNPRWLKYCKRCKGGRIYNPYPDEKYYRDVLGDPKDFGVNLEETK